MNAVTKQAALERLKAYVALSSNRLQAEAPEISEHARAASADKCFQSAVAPLGSYHEPERRTNSNRYAPPPDRFGSCEPAALNGALHGAPHGKRARPDVCTEEAPALMAGLAELVEARGGSATQLDGWKAWFVMNDTGRNRVYQSMQGKRFRSEAEAARHLGLQSGPAIPVKCGGEEDEDYHAAANAVRVEEAYPLPLQEQVVGSKLQALTLLGGRWYDAVVVERRGAVGCFELKVHWPGWKKTFDTWLPLDRLRSLHAGGTRASSDRPPPPSAAGPAPPQVLRPAPPAGAPGAPGAMEGAVEATAADLAAATVAGQKELSWSRENSQLEPELAQPGSTGVKCASLRCVDSARRCARYLQDRWRAGALPLEAGRRPIRGYGRYGKTLAPHDSTQQRDHTLLVSNALLAVARKHIPGFHQMEKELAEWLHDHFGTVVELFYAHILNQAH